MKALKITLIVLFAFLLAVSGGLLVYGALQAPPIQMEEESASYSAPAVGLYLGEYADKKVDIVAIKNGNTSSSSAERAAKMLVNASYNNIFINQFYYSAHVDVNPTGKSSKYACSDYYRAKNGANMFYQTLAYTGSWNPLQIKIDYIDQRIKTSPLATAKYNLDTKKWSYNAQPGDVSSSDVSLPEPTPYNLYSWYDFPLDLGGVRVCGNGSTAGRTEDIDFSLIDEKTVKIDEKQDADGNVFYRIAFKAIISKAQKSSETIARFSESYSSLKNVEFSELSFEVDVWKAEGVFRKIEYNARVTASIGNDRGEVKINKLLAFSYDDIDCSVAAHIKKLADNFTQKWITDLSASNQAKIQEELAALPQETDDTDTTEK